MRFDFWILENVSLENKQFWWQLFVDSFPIFSNLLFISWFIFQTLNRVRYARGGGAQPARNQIPFGFVFSCCVCCVVLCCMFVCLRFIEIAWNCATYQTLICPCSIPLLISILSIHAFAAERYVTLDAIFDGHASNLIRPDDQLHTPTHTRHIRHLHSERLLYYRLKIHLKWRSHGEGMFSRANCWHPSPNKIGGERNEGKVREPEQTTQFSKQANIYLVLLHQLI